MREDLDYWYEDVIGRNDAGKLPQLLEKLLKLKKGVSFVLPALGPVAKVFESVRYPRLKSSNLAIWLTNNACVSERSHKTSNLSALDTVLSPINRIEPSIRRKSAEVHRGQTGVKRHVHASDVFICKQHQNPDKLSIR